MEYATVAVKRPLWNILNLVIIFSYASVQQTSFVAKHSCSSCTVERKTFALTQIVLSELDEDKNTVMIIKLHCHNLSLAHQLFNNCPWPQLQFFHMSFFFFHFLTQWSFAQSRLYDFFLSQKFQKFLLIVYSSLFTPNKLKQNLRARVKLIQSFRNDLVFF